MIKWRPGPPPIQLEGEVVLVVLKEEALPDYTGKPVAALWTRHYGKTTFGGHQINKDDVAFHHTLKGRRSYG